MDPPHGVHNILEIHTDDYIKEGIYGRCLETAFIWGALRRSWLTACTRRCSLLLSLGREGWGSLSRFGVTTNGAEESISLPVVGINYQTKRRNNTVCQANNYVLIILLRRLQCWSDHVVCSPTHTVTMKKSVNVVCLLQRQSYTVTVLLSLNGLFHIRCWFFSTLGDISFSVPVF